MNRNGRNPRCLAACLFVCLLLDLPAMSPAVAGVQLSTLDTVFPAGGQAGQTVQVTITGGNLEALRALQCSAPGIQCERLKPGQFRLTIPPDTTPGLYDLWAVGDSGVTNLRTFFIGNRSEQLEDSANDDAGSAPVAPLNATVNGRIELAGDRDHFRFSAKRGQCVVVECWSERIDSRLRPVLEIFDSQGRRLAVNRGYFATDPLIAFSVPADGDYVIKVHDLIWAGGPEYYYRLDIDTGPRVLFSVPSAVERGRSSRVTLHGWNIVPSGRKASDVPAPVAADGPEGVLNTAPPADSMQRLEVEISPADIEQAWPVATRLAAVGATSNRLNYHLPGSHTALPIDVSDVPVILDRLMNHTPGTAQEVTVPCEVSGQLAGQEERDWYAVDARRGDVLYIEGIADRIQSPIDLEVSIFDGAGVRELGSFGDERASIGGTALPTQHLDPSGRWVVPQDGRFLIMCRNIRGGSAFDARRIYRLSIRREEPDVALVAVPHSGSAVNVRRGGRELVDVLAFRKRGMDGTIRIAAENLPVGVDCPDVWLGPGVDRTTVVVSADWSAPSLVGTLSLHGYVDERGPGESQLLAGPIPVQAGGGGGVGRSVSSVPAARLRDWPVRSGTVVRGGTPTAWSRTATQLPLAIAGEAPWRVSANGHELIEHHLYGSLQVRHSPGGILDVAVEIERAHPDHQAPVKLVGVGVPELIQNQTAIVPAGQQKGYLSFYLPPTLPPGQYSLVIRSETTVPGADSKPVVAVAFSNPVGFNVEPAAFLVELDPFAPTRVRRGDLFQIRYSAQRLHGFIGKMHTELAIPGHITNVTGLRARGETFVGQTDSGSLQIVVNQDAPLGRVPFLRLLTVGVVEDQPIYFGSRFFDLEVIE